MTIKKQHKQGKVSFAFAFNDKDSLLTIGQTAKKLFVSAYEYIHDRVSNKFEMPSHPLHH